MKTSLLTFTTVCLLFVGCSKEVEQNALADNNQNHLKSTAVINGNTYYQTIDGFGFSSAWCGALTSAKNNALYGTLGFSLLRVRIDQNNRWGDETSNASAAHAAGAKVLGCPWYIPTAYRSGNTIPSSQYVNYCNWLKSAASSIRLDYVSIKNEPDGSSTDGNLSGDQIRDIIKAGGSNIGKPLACSDAIGFNDSWTDPTLNDATAVGKVTCISGHLYGNGLYTHTNALNKGKHVWMTEHYIANSRDNINNAVVQAKEIQDCMNNQFSAYFYWWVNDNDASVNLVNQSGSIYKAGYVAGQFAKYIRPGKQRITCTYNPASNVYVTAYRGGGIVVVAVNNGSSSVSQTFSFSNITGLSTMNVTRTSSSENMASKGTVTLSNNSFTYSLPAQSVTTFHQF
jgi:glucuronoarabinoxylan endo-1,4-beta-xylanase